MTDQQLLEIADERNLHFKHLWDIPTKTVNELHGLSLTSQERRRLRNLLWHREMKQQMDAHPSTDCAYWESLAEAFGLEIVKCDELAVCPHCRQELKPAEWMRVDGERIRCGKCGGVFVERRSSLRMT